MADASRYSRGLQALFRGASWDRSRLEAYQSRCLRSLVRHAWERVPYYRELFEQHGVRPEEIRGIADLDRLPVSTRAEMQERPPEELVARGLDPARLIVHRTSGSTGAPFAIRRTWFEERLLHAVRLRERLRCGFRLTDVRTGVGLVRPGSQRKEFHTRLGMLRTEHVNCLLPAREILARLAEIQPDVINGYSGSLSWIATEATAEDRAKIRPRLIFTAAETLTPDMRRQIAEGFGVPVYDFYGAHECNLLAVECPATGLYHVTEAITIVEILNDGETVRPGESGEVVVTALHSFAMPFLRYRLGDIATRGPDQCRCGASFRTLKSIQGRVMDRFPLPDGSTLHPYHLIRALNQESAWLRRYQIVQTRIDHIMIRIIPLRGKTPRDEEWRGRIRSRVGDAVGAGVTVEIALVDELPAAANGKFRPYYSMVRDAER